MKAQMSHWVGIDVSKETLDGAVLKSDGSVKAYNTSNDENGFKIINELIGTDGCCILEATGTYYYKLVHYLHEQNKIVYVVNPLAAKNYRGAMLNRVKTDKQDAIMLAQMGKTQELRQWMPEPTDIAEMRQLITFMDQLHKQKTQITNQIEAYSQMVVVSKLVMKTLEEQKLSIEKQILEVEKEMDRFVKKNYSENFERLMSIPGIGKKTATALIAITSNFTKFNNYKQLAAYIGLTPKIFQSGKSVSKRGAISKMGYGAIRKLLYLCSWSAKRFNPVCIAFYKRLSNDKKKPERVCKMALAHQLLRIAFSIVKNKTVFDFQKKIA